jgi:hypothetical protein
MPEKYDEFEKKGELWAPKEERGHIRSPEEIKEAKEAIPEEKKIESAEEKTKKAEEWYETFTQLGGTRRGRQWEEEYQREKKEVESAKVPEKGMKREDMLKKAGGIEKPAESFGEFQKRLVEKTEKRRTYKGEKLSRGDKLMIERRAYLGELGYSVKYKGALLDKVEILGEDDKPIHDGKGKPIKFGSFYFDKTEKSVNDFLREKVKEKLEGKPAKEMTEEKKEEAGVKKAVKETQNQQEEREAKISSLREGKEADGKKLGKAVERLSLISAFKELGVLGFRAGKKLAIEGGKDLAAIGLTPAAAIEEALRERGGTIKIGEAMEKIFKPAIKESRKGMLKKEDFERLSPRVYEIIEAKTREQSDEIVKARKLIFEKGRILRLLENWGIIGKTIGEKLTPHPSRKEKYE